MSIRTPRGQRGITLIEIILVLAIVASATVAIFVFAKKASVTAAVENEQRQIEDIVKTVDGLFATQPNFSALGTNGAEYLKARAARSGLKFSTDVAGEPGLLTGLGGGSGTLTLSVRTVALPTGLSAPDNAYRLAYNGLTADECVRLVTASYPVAYSVHVSQDVDDVDGVRLSERGQLAVSPDKIAENCAASPSPSAFLYFVPARAIAAAPTPTPPPAARCNTVHETQQTACPVGQMGAITQERDGTCTGPGNSMVYTPWATTDNTCQVSATQPPTVVPPSSPDDCTIITTTRVQACPAGQTGQILEESARDTCAGTQTAWVQLPPPLGNTCQTPLLATCVPSSEYEVVGCPSGQGGQIVRERYSTCASPQAVPAWPAWSSTHVISNTCTANCGVSSTSPFGNTCCTPIPEERDAPCPAGTYGPGGKEVRFQGCANATTQASTWSAWQPYRDLEPSAGCTACPANVTETNTQWVPRSGTCPAGETGTLTYDAEQVQTRDVSYSCPAGTAALPAASYTVWSGWMDTGATGGVTDTCTPAACAGSPTATQWVATAGICPAGEAGTNAWEREQLQSRVCTAGTWGSFGAWSDTGATRNPVYTCAPVTCSGSSTQTQWLGNSAACPAGQSGTNTWEYEQAQSRICTAGTWGSWGAWGNTGNTRNPVYTCAPNCVPPAPETESQWVGTSAACPAGQSGTHAWEYAQTRTRTAYCPAATGPFSWNSWGAWTATGATRNVVNTCAPPVACYKPSAIAYTQSGPGDGPANFSSQFVINGNEGQTSCEDRGTNLDCMGTMQGYTGPWDGYFNGTYNLSPQGLSIDPYGLVLPVSGKCSPGDFGTFSTLPKPSGAGWRMSDTWEWTCEARPAADCP